MREFVRQPNSGSRFGAYVVSNLVSRNKANDYTSTGIAVFHTITLFLDYMVAAIVPFCTSLSDFSFKAKPSSNALAKTDNEIKIGILIALGPGRFARKLYPIASANIAPISRVADKYKRNVILSYFSTQNHSALRRHDKTK